MVRQEFLSFWRIRMSNGHKYTEEEKQYLKEFVPGRSRKEITDTFNRRFGTNLNINAMSSAYKRFGFSTGRTGYFDKGQEPFNKGKKMPKEIYKKCAGTMFKKGNTPINHKPIGTESVRTRKNRSNCTYVWVKVAEPHVWRMKHVLVWERHKGPIPKGMLVIFLDGDHLNCDIDNLALIDRATHARLNQNKLRFPDKDLTRTGIAAAQLITAISKAQK